MDFIVLGLPRSGTTWLANWLTTDRSLCLHDPFNELPENWPCDERRFGISCTGVYLMPKWLKQWNCPVAVIERDPAKCDASLGAMGLGTTEQLLEPFQNVEGRRFAFADIWAEENAAELWAYLLPGIPFDALRYRQLKHMQVQPYQWRLNETVLAELAARGFFER